MKLDSDRNIRLDISYDGTDFQGWQIQKEDRTVQGELGKALAKLHGHPVNLTGSGRTDSGVHASGQVANFYSDHKSIPSEKFREALNSHLPKDIRVMESRQVSHKFHSRFDAHSRVYKYYIMNGAVCPAHQRNFCYYTHPALDLRRLNQLASPLTGVHDFTSFAAVKDKNENKVRYIYSARFLREGPFIVFRIAGNAFLWRMVRTLVGTLLLLDLEKAGPEKIKKIMEGKNRLLAGPSLPAKGLFFHKVLYESETTIY
ncbi:MAG: tRNA pseudouridine(38-40) synthase TruA [Spirochaetaceae bacterium 4572_59]|nr:MAG: tRNA pseudouridine(38-40) synthase TruA [Spirochaetaceae bacterium 4572_59]